MTETTTKEKNPEAGKKKWDLENILTKILIYAGFSILVWSGVSVTFLSEHSIYNYTLLKRDINVLETERDELRKTIGETNDELYLFQQEKNQLEKLAREKYYMRKGNEDVFIIKDATNYAD